MEAVGKFSLTLGFLIADSVISDMKKAAWDLGINIEVEKFGGIISIDYGITVRGDKDKVQLYLETFKKWSDKFNS